MSRRRRQLAVLAGAAAVVVSLGFWSVALGRPYGALVHPDFTAWAADVSVSGWAGGSERFLAGEPGRMGGWRRLALWIPPPVVLAIPTLLPPVVVAVTGLAIAALWHRRSRALAALLWFAGSTGTLVALRGYGLSPLVWHHPGRAVLWAAGVVLWLAVTRIAGGRPRAAIVIALLAVVATSAGWGGPRPELPDALLLITLDQGPWFWAGLGGLLRRRDAGARAIVAGGAAVVLLSALGAPFIAWCGTAWLRLGLILAVADVVPPLARWVARRWRTPPHAWSSPARALPALVLWTAFAGGHDSWWDPARSDVVANESLSPFPADLLDAMQWVRAQTPPGSAFVAAPEYAPAIAALGGRRVLRAPGILAAADEERRRRLERAIFAGRAPDLLLRRYGVRYLFIAPGQFREYGIEAPEQVEARGPFRLRYVNERGMRVYEIEPRGASIQ